MCKGYARRQKQSVQDKAPLEKFRSGRAEPRWCLQGQGLTSIFQSTVQNGKKQGGGFKITHTHTHTSWLCPVPTSWTLTKSSCHGLVQSGLAVPRGQVWAGVVPALVVIVLHIETRELGEVDAQRAAGVVDVLSIQRLRGNKTSPHPNAFRPSSQQLLSGERRCEATPQLHLRNCISCGGSSASFSPSGSLQATYGSNSFPLMLCPWGNIGVSPPWCPPWAWIKQANPSESNPGMQHSPVWHAEHSWGQHIAAEPETGGSSWMWWFSRLYQIWKRSAR